MSRDIVYSISRFYNVFGADEHIEVSLWQQNSKKTKWHEIESHTYAMGLTGVGKHLADRKIRQWIRDYGAYHCEYLDD